MVSPMMLSAWLPSALRLANGENVSFSENPTPSATFYINEHGVADPTDPDNRNMTAYHQIIGAITKYDQVCGPRGTLSLMDEINIADNNPNVTSHLLYIDSGGGQGTNLETVAHFIRNKVQKPIYAITNGMMCSAAYYIGCACDAIYAEEGTDIIGSIGVMMTLADVKRKLEKEGIDIKEVYADQSTLKNIDFKVLFEENDETMIKETILNPYAEAFINTVQEFRPGITDADAFKGKIYTATQATSIGLIDGVKSHEEVLQIAMNKGRETQLNLSLKSNTNMKDFPMLLALGLAFSFDENGMAEMSQSDIETIEASLAARQEESTEEVESDERIEGLEASLNNINSSIATLTTSMTSVMNKIKKLDASPAAGPAQASADEDPSPDMSELEKLNKEMEEVGLNGRFS